MGEYHLRPPEELIGRMQRAMPVRLFVETGTYYGDTACWASERFDKVWTIEFSEECYKGAVERNRSLANVSFLLGDSRKLLPEIVAELSSAALFWLDAHYSGNETYGQSDECPLLDELAIINRSTFENAIIIDDARFFLSPPQPFHPADQWPDISSVLGQLNAIPNRYIVILEDLIVAVPPPMKAAVVGYSQEAATLRREARLAQGIPSVTMPKA
jgi:hypothetical protein